MTPPRVPRRTHPRSPPRGAAWNDCCTDGMILGYMPTTNWAMDFGIDKLTGPTPGSWGEAVSWNRGPTFSPIPLALTFSHLSPSDSAGTRRFPTPLPTLGPASHASPF